MCWISKLQFTNDYQNMFGYRRTLEWSRKTAWPPNIEIRNSLYKDKRQEKQNNTDITAVVWRTAKNRGKLFTPCRKAFERAVKWASIELPEGQCTLCCTTHSPTTLWWMVETYLFWEIFWVILISRWPWYIHTFHQIILKTQFIKNHSTFYNVQTYIDK